MMGKHGADDKACKTMHKMEGARFRTELGKFEMFQGKNCEKCKGALFQRPYILGNSNFDAGALKKQRSYTSQC